MAIFFGIAGGLTSIGPIAGGYLTEWTWRSIFWVNVPVAIIALFLTWKAKPADERHPAQDRLQGHRPRLRRHGAAGPGPAAVGDLGLGRRQDLGRDRDRRRDPRLASSTTSSAREPAAAAADLRGPRLRGRQRRPLPPDDRLRAAVLLRQRVRADLARRIGLGNRPLPADLLRRLRRPRLAVRRQHARPESAPGDRGRRAARSAPSASASGANR